MNKPTLETYSSRDEARTTQVSGGRRIQGLLPRHPDVSRPLVSIVTVVRNGRKTIESTILSVNAQTYPNIEFIVVDGCSTDGTVDLIRKFENLIDLWISEPDQGISDAWNKGVSFCRGEIIGILNADDTYATDMVECVVRALEPNTAGYCYSTVVMIDESQKKTREFRGKFNPAHLFSGIGFLYPGSFCTRKAYEEIGLFDLSYRLAMDTDWILRYYRAGFPISRNSGYCFMRNDGVASKQWKEAWKEYDRALAENAMPFLTRLGSRAYYMLLTLKKALFGGGR